MILPTPGADPASRRFGYSTPPGGAGPIGLTGLWPQPLDVPFSDVLKALNLLHHVPAVGTIDRAATGETIPALVRILGAGVFGGAIGILGAAVMSFVGKLFRMEPDLSRPPVPAGTSETGFQAPMNPVTPGTLKPGGYATLATNVPEFQQSPTRLAGGAQRGHAAYRLASQEWLRSQALEKGLL